MARASGLKAALGGMPVSKRIATLAVLAAIAAMALSDAPLISVAAISIAAIALFATRALPEPVTAAATFLAFLAVSAAPPDVIFSGFATGGFWLLFSGLVIGTAISTTGLARQIALRIFQRTGASYARAVWLLGTGGFLLGLLVPSAIPRVIVMMPITLALSEAMGFKPGSRGMVGLTITSAMTTLVPTYVFLTANLPTIVQFGAMETIYGVSTTFTGYLLYQLPVNLMRMVVLMAALLLLMRGAEGAPGGDDGVEAPKPLDTAQKRLLSILVVAILLWVSDFAHGISPAWVALAAAAALLAPPLGIMENTAMKKEIDLSPAFFIAAVFAVSAVAVHSGLSDAFADAVIPRLGLGEGGSLRDLYSVVGFSTLISHLTTAPATPVVLAPLAQPIADAAGWTLETVAMAQVIGIATTVLPYQAPPLVLAIALAGIPVAALTRVCLILAVAVIFPGVPLTWAWWTLLGYF